jgi:hypothetical protein
MQLLFSTIFFIFIFISIEIQGILLPCDRPFKGSGQWVNKANNSESGTYVVLLDVRQNDNQTSTILESIRFDDGRMFDWIFMAKEIMPTNSSIRFDQVVFSNADGDEIGQGFCFPDGNNSKGRKCHNEITIDGVQISETIFNHRSCVLERIGSWRSSQDYTLFGDDLFDIKKDLATIL